MKITHGVDEVYYKSFILTEDGLKGFHKILENAAQRFPAPAEIVYTVTNPPDIHPAPAGLLGCVPR
jgi:hypothetical protein